jgi:hypothetical protein
MAVLEVRPGHEPFLRLCGEGRTVDFSDWARGIRFRGRGHRGGSRPARFPLLRRPRWRREGDFIFQRMQRILQELGSDLSHGVRLDQHYPTPAAVDPYHRARRGVRRLHSAKHVGRHGALLWGGRRHLLVSDRRSARQRIRSSENLSEGCHCIGQLGVCADDCLQRVCVCRRAHGEWTGTRTGSAGACS